MNKLQKILIWLLGFLIIGPLADDIWEFFIKPFLKFIATWFYKTMLFFNNSYIDNIYKEASAGKHEFPPIVAMLAFSILSFFILLKIKTNFKGITDIQKIITRFSSSWDGGFIISLIWGVTFAFGINYILRFYNVDQAIISSQKSINIVAPFVTEEERLHLRSTLASVKTSEDFRSFRNNVERVAEKNNMEVPEIYIISDFR